MMPPQDPEYGILILMRDFTKLCTEAAHVWYEKDADHWSAVISYYALFAVTPLLLISIVLVGALFGQDLVSSMLVDWGEVLGPNIIDLLTIAIHNLRQVAGHVQIPVFGLLFIFGAVVVAFNAFTTGLQALWSIPHQGFHGWVKKSIRSLFFLVFLQGYLAILVGIDAMMISITQGLDGGVLATPLFLIVTLLRFLTYTLLFTSAFWLLPDTRPAFGSLLFGGAISSFLLLVGKYAIGFYVVHTPIPGLFGGAGIIVVLLIWIFVTAAIVFYGAAFGYVHSGRTLKKNFL